MVDELSDRIASFEGEINHTRCFAHTVNLVVKVIQDRYGYVYLVFAILPVA